MDTSAHRAMLTEVEADISALELQIANLRSVAAYHASKLGKVQPAAPASKYADSSLFMAVTKQPDAFKHLNQREAAEVIIKSEKRPMRAPEIAARLIAGGFPTTMEKRKLANSVFTTLNRDPKRFKKVGAGLWDLVREDQSQAG